MKKLSFRLAALTLILGISFGSCKKALDDFSYLADGESVVDHADTETEFDDIDASSQSSMNERGVFSGTGITVRNGCPTVTAPAVGSLVVDFGAGCKGKDGRIRKGIINVTYTGKYMDNGSVITMVPSNYFVSSKLDSTKFTGVEGTRRITNITGATGNPKHSIEIIGGKLTFTDGKVFLWEANRVREWSVGFATPANAYDDEFTITNGNLNGTAGSGVTRKGAAFTVTIKTPILVKTACFLSGIFKPVSGAVTFAATDVSRTIDYGAVGSGCDKRITITFERNGRTYTTVVTR